MNIRLALKSMRPGRSRITFNLYKDIEVVSEVMSKTGLMVVAEIGGYLGLTLGISLMDLKLLFSLLKFCQTPVPSPDFSLGTRS